MALERNDSVNCWCEKTAWYLKNEGDLMEDIETRCDRCNKSLDDEIDPVMCDICLLFFCKVSSWFKTFFNFDQQQTRPAQRSK
jgi:hypothetical protein